MVKFSVQEARSGVRQVGRHGFWLEVGLGQLARYLAMVGSSLSHRRSRRASLGMTRPGCRDRVGRKMR